MLEEVKTLKFLLDISTNAFLEIDIYGTIIYANSKIGYIVDNSKLVGMKLTDAVEPIVSQNLLYKVQEVIKQKTVANIPLYYKSRHYNAFIYPYSQSALVCIEDITEKREISDILYKTSQRLEFAEKTSKMGYWEMDIKSKNMYWSAEMYKIFGLNAKHVSHKRNLIKEHLIPEDLSVYKDKIAQLIHHGKSVDGIVRIKNSKDKLVYCSFKASCINEQGGSKIAGTFQDLTQLIETQIALEESKKEAERLNLAKSYFLAQASHDLRQPMQALNIFIHNLSNEKLTEVQNNILGKIEASAANLKSLLDNLLDVSTLDAGGITYIGEEFNIGELLRNMAKEFEPQSLIKHINFKFISTNKTVISDPFLVERIIRNLLSNAFKYTKNKILLGCKMEKDYVKIMVIDNGPGIDEQDLKYLFDDFYQSNKLVNNKKKGVGLGLSIVKKIANILHTKVHVATALGKGSCFFFYLPIIKKHPKT